MMPNIDPRALKSMMDRMGIKSEEIDADEVTIHCKDKIIKITNPSVILIDAKGNLSFQISGTVEEHGNIKMEVDEEDVKVVMESTGITNKEIIKKALEDANGDIAEAILKLKE
jgi:nascent polypeptide-associated complex subunit alpha